MSVTRAFSSHEIRAARHCRWSSKAIADVLRSDPFAFQHSQSARQGTVSCLNSHRCTESLSDCLHELISYVLPAALTIRLGGIAPQ